MKTKKDSWIIVTNKKTYLFLLAAIGSIVFWLGDMVYTLVMKRREISDLVGDSFMCLIIAIICIYLFVRFNTYSHFYNPDHPKPDYKKEEK